MTHFDARYGSEDTAGRGMRLAFPGVSSCVAVVVRRADALVGWHVTVGTLGDLKANTGFALQGAAKCRQ